MKTSRHSGGASLSCREGVSGLRGLRISGVSLSSPPSGSLCGETEPTILTEIQKDQDPRQCEWEEDDVGAGGAWQWSTRWALH